jgi:hypothetical protein
MEKGAATSKASEIQKGSVDQTKPSMVWPLADPAIHRLTLWIFIGKAKKAP